MYRGSRDAHMCIKVPMEFCFEVKLASGIWIEVFVPPHDITRPMAEWKSFIVAPKQVCWIDKTYNMIEEINAHTDIRLCQHYNDTSTGYRRAIQGTDIFLDPYDIQKNIDYYVYKKSVS